jgi:HlyD family secretion protein
MFTTKNLSIIALGLAIVTTVWWFYTSIAGVVGNEQIYRVTTITRGPLVSTIAASGTLQAVVTVNVGTQVSGMIKTLHADFNSLVEAGQVIAEIDSAPFEIRLRQARAELAVAQARVAMEEASLQGLQAELHGLRATLKEAEDDLVRKRSLQSDGSIVSSSVVGTALTNREQASAKLKAGLAGLAEQKAHIELTQAEAQQRTAAVEQRQVELDYTYIRSPISGVVISRNVDAGQTIAASLQTPELFWIAQDLANMEVRINVDEADIGNIRDAQKIRFSVDTYPEKTFEGRVHQIRKAGLEVSHVVSYTVIATADNAEQLLLPGMTANVTIVVNEHENVLKIPNMAFFFRPWSPEEMRTRSDSRVWVLDDAGEPKSVAIQYGATDGSVSEVVNGDLTEGQQIIIGVKVPVSTN